MSKIIIRLIIVMLFFFEESATAGIIDLNDLVENGKAFDGKSITIEGEAIGETLERGRYAWVNISDQSNVMGIWMKIEDAENIKFFGDYKHKGDIIKVTGIFRRACSEHGGDMDIHGTALEVVELGYPVKEEVGTSKIIVVIVLSLISLCMVGFYFKLRNN